MQRLPHSQISLCPVCWAQVIYMLPSFAIPGQETPNTANGPLPTPPRDPLRGRERGPGVGSPARGGERKRVQDALGGKKVPDRRRQPGPRDSRAPPCPRQGTRALACSRALQGSHLRGGLPAPHAPRLAACSLPPTGRPKSGLPETPQAPPTRTGPAPGPPGPAPRPGNLELSGELGNLLLRPWGAWVVPRGPCGCGNQAKRPFAQEEYRGPVGFVGGRLGRGCWVHRAPWIRGEGAGNRGWGAELQPLQDPKMTNGIVQASISPALPLPSHRGVIVQRHSQKLAKQ